MILFRVKKYLEYKKRAVNQFGLHSPFLFELYNSCFKPRFRHTFPEIDSKRRELSSNKSSLEVADFGAGSLVSDTKSRKVKEMYNSASISKKQGELFNRLVKHLQPKTILELGTHLGVSGLYFLDGTDAHLTTIEACENTQNLAKRTLSTYSDRLTMVLGTFRTRLPDVLNSQTSIDLMYVDGNHDFENTIWHFESLLKHVNENSVMIFDDINWTEDMAKAWEQIIEQKEVTISINCFKFGLVFFRKGIEKQNFYFKL